MNTIFCLSDADSPFFHSVGDESRNWGVCFPHLMSWRYSSRESCLMAHLRLWHSFTLLRFVGVPYRHFPPCFYSQSAVCWRVVYIKDTGKVRKIAIPAHLHDDCIVYYISMLIHLLFEGNLSFLWSPHNLEWNVTHIICYLFKFDLCPIWDFWPSLTNVLIL